MPKASLLEECGVGLGAGRAVLAGNSQHRQEPGRERVQVHARRDETRRRERLAAREGPQLGERKRQRKGARESM